VIAVYVLVGAVAAFAVRALVARALLFKLRRDIAQLSAGNYAPLLAGYASDAVLHFNDGEGNLLYSNRTALVAHTRWGRITEQWDFYEDTGRILEFEAKLSQLTGG